MDNWPTSLGAPTIEVRMPLFYGDRMIWMAQVTERDSGPEAQEMDLPLNK
ncbi:MAG: hypothetical protein ACI80V_003013 [Rhodothermales bacterium]|jgi:hypothetical protein